MISLSQIARNVIKEGGKLFGPRAARVSTDEMQRIFEKVKSILSSDFSKIQLTRALKSKTDHGDIDIVILNHGGLDVMATLKDRLGDSVVDSSHNGNIYSILYHSKDLNKSVHIDFLSASNDDDYGPQYEYLSFNDFSGILGVMSRKVRYNYGTQGFFKIYEDKRGQYHYVLITKNLREGLRILGFDTVLPNYDKIETVDDIVNFIISSPFFDSKYYTGQDMNHSDKKRVRAGRPSADYIRKKLIELNKSRTIEDDDYFLKSLYPEYYKKLQDEIHRIETTVVPKSKYNGGWLMANFSQIKPGPLVGKILKFWHDKYGDNLDNVDEEELKISTSEYLKSL